MLQAITKSKLFNTRLSPHISCSDGNCVLIVQSCAYLHGYHRIRSALQVTVRLMSAVDNWLELVVVVVAAVVVVVDVS